jgi:hypothetical protein
VPFSFELASCLCADLPFFGCHTEKRNVRFVSRRSGYHMRLARSLLTGAEIKFPCEDTADHVAAIDGERDPDSFTTAEIADHYTAHIPAGSVVVIADVVATLGIRSKPKHVRALCADLVTEASSRELCLVVAMDASEADGEHYRGLLNVFDSHAVVIGSANDGGEWWVPYSLAGHVGHGGAFTVRNVTIGEQANGETLIAPTIIDPATCTAFERYITAGARALVA